jgi:RHS repeat-associated protein
VVDEDGDVVASYDADEFGNSILVDENGASTDQRWVGGLGYKDEVAATGLYYLRQRYYDPGLGRFISRDPIGLRGDLNLYQYELVHLALVREYGKGYSKQFCGDDPVHPAIFFGPNGGEGGLKWLRTHPDIRALIQQNF